MVSLKGLKSLVTFLMLMSIIAMILPVVTAEYDIDFSQLNISPGQEIRVTLNDIPQDALVNMTLDGDIKTTPGQEIDYQINEFLFPYESGISVFEAEMLNLVPGTPATVTVLREDGTEASRTGNVSEEGRFNASIQHELNRGQYNVSFIGIPASTIAKANVNFGGNTKTSAAASSEAATTESTFILGGEGVSDATVEMKVYINKELQKQDTITLSSGA